MAYPGSFRIDYYKALYMGLEKCLEASVDTECYCQDVNWNGMKSWPIYTGSQFVSRVNQSAHINLQSLIWSGTSILKDHLILMNLPNHYGHLSVVIPKLWNTLPRKIHLSPAFAVFYLWVKNVNIYSLCNSSFLLQVGLNTEFTVFLASDVMSDNNICPDCCKW